MSGKSAWELLTVCARSLRCEEIFEICLFCWPRMRSGNNLCSSRQFSHQGSCNNCANRITMGPDPDPSIPGMWHVQFESSRKGLFKTVLISQRNILVGEKSQIKVLKAVFRRFLVITVMFQKWSHVANFVATWKFSVSWCQRKKQISKNYLGDKDIMRWSWK